MSDAKVVHLQLVPRPTVALETMSREEADEIIQAFLDNFGPQLMAAAVRRVQDLERAERRNLRAAPSAASSVRYRERADALMHAAGELEKLRITLATIQPFRSTPASAR